MTTKQKVEFEQRMFDFIVTRDVAAAAINCMDVAEEMIQKELAIRDKKIDELKAENEALRQTVSRYSDKIIKLSQSLNPKT